MQRLLSNIYNDIDPVFHCTLHKMNPASLFRSLVVSWILLAIEIKSYPGKCTLLYYILPPHRHNEITEVSEMESSGVRERGGEVDGALDYIYQPLTLRIHLNWRPGQLSFDQYGAQEENDSHQSNCHKLHFSIEHGFQSCP